MILKVKNKPTNRITLYSKFNYALHNYYDDDFYQVPDPVLGNNKNTYIYFISNSAGTATVDWGDGQTEVFDFIKRTTEDYMCAWRSLDIDYLKNPAAINKGWGLGINEDTNEVIIPYPNHKYEDGDKNIRRTVNITFSNEITHFYSNVNVMVEFPLIELPDLLSLNISNTKNINQIPIDRIAKLTKLQTLEMTALGSRIQRIPDSIFKLTDLISLVWGAGVNLSNTEVSNIRQIKNLKNLTNIDIRSCLLPSYIKEFNELPNLTSLYIGNGATVLNNPSFEEIDQINPTLTTFNWLLANGNVLSSRTDWGEQVSGKGIHKITNLNVTHGRSLSLTLPQYIKEMRNLNSFSLASSLHTAARIDTFVNNFYEYVTVWEHTTMSATAKDQQRNQFYNLQVKTYSSTYPEYNYTPSGTLQAPTGFAKGVSNGNPTTPMEKIYVLTQNYKQIWTIKPATQSTQVARATTPSILEYNQIIDNSMIVSAEGIEYKNEIITLTDEEFRERENFPS